MNRIHRKLEYALMALEHMRQKPAGELTTTKEVCQRYKVPFDATARVLQQMVQMGFLESAQGAQGGYSLCNNLSEVSLLQLVEAVDGPLEVVRCIEGSVQTCCDIKETCNIQGPLQVFNERLAQFYAGIPVAELLNSNLNQGLSVNQHEVLS